MTQIVTLVDAEQQLTAATATLDQLKAKILGQGPGTVTAEELGTAALAVEHARLTVQHAGQQAMTEAEAVRQQQLHELKARILDQAGDVDAALDAMRKIQDAAAVLITACTGRQQLIAQATATMRKASVPPLSRRAAAQNAGLAWSDAGMGRSDELHVDGRKIGPVNAGMLIASAIQQATRTAGCTPGHLSPALEVGGPSIVGDPEVWLRTRY